MSFSWLKRPVGALLLLAALAMFGGGLLWLVRAEAPVRYEPVVHDDGTVEYRLIARGQDGERGSFDDVHWVLRFPSHYNVSYLEDRIEAITQSPPTEPYPYNSAMQLVFKLPNFEPITGEFPALQSDALVINITAAYSDYQDVVEARSTSRPYTRTNIECREDGEVHDGVFALRDPTEDERRAALEKYGDRITRFSSTCSIGSDGKSNYAVYDKVGQPIGYGDCRLVNEAASIRQCNFQFFLPQNKRAHFNFHQQHLPQVQSMYSFVVDVLTNATDTKKSTPNTMDL